MSLVHSTGRGHEASRNRRSRTGAGAGVRRHGVSRGTADRHLPAPRERSRQTTDFTLDQGVDAAAPAGVAPNGTVAVTIDPAPNTIPSEAGGRQVREVKGLALRLPVPANSTFRSASLSGGSGLGGTPTISLQGTDVVLNVPGPIKGGAAFELPTVTIGLQAGASGTITTKLGGTGYDAPGLTFTAVVTVLGFPVNAAAKGYPDPSPVLTTTTIG